MCFPRGSSPENLCKKIASKKDAPPKINTEKKTSDRREGVGGKQKFREFSWEKFLLWRKNESASQEVQGNAQRHARDEKKRGECRSDEEAQKQEEGEGSLHREVTRGSVDVRGTSLDSYAPFQKGECTAENEKKEGEDLVERDTQGRERWKKGRLTGRRDWPSLASCHPSLFFSGKVWPKGGKSLRGEGAGGKSKHFYIKEGGGKVPKKGRREGRTLYGRGLRRVYSASQDFSTGGGGRQEFIGMDVGATF